MIAQCRRGILSVCPRSRPTTSRIRPAPASENARNVHTEISRIASGNNVQLVPQTTVRTNTNNSARGGTWEVGIICKACTLQCSRQVPWPFPFYLRSCLFEHQCGGILRAHG